MAGFQELIKGDQPVLVDFYADWCGPCKTMMPVLEYVSGMVGDKAKIIKIDVDKNLQAAKAYKVMGVPTFVLFKKGEIVWRQAGVLSKEQLIKILNEHV